MQALNNDLGADPTCTSMPTRGTFGKLPSIFIAPVRYMHPRRQTFRFWGTLFLSASEWSGKSEWEKKNKVNKKRKEINHRNEANKQTKSQRRTRDGNHPCNTLNLFYGMRKGRLHATISVRTQELASFFLFFSSFLFSDERFL